jgi:hypothetical protein
LPKLLIGRRAAIAPVQLGQDGDGIDRCTRQGQDPCRAPGVYRLPRRPRPV